MHYFPYLIRLILSVIIGGLIGLERSESNHEAGLRTHILVCLGSASVMVLSCMISADNGNINDVTRMGAQVISGIGFLGAGSIIFDKTHNKIKGITTAAGIWTTACIGLVLGMGYYIIAISIFLLMIFAMLGLKSLTKRLRLKTNYYNLHLSVDESQKIDFVNNLLNSAGLDIISFSCKKDGNLYALDYELESNSVYTKSELIEKLSPYYDNISVS